ncbi:MAG TPA: hypothetical protein VLS27_17740 [Gammaproteobacteria bacterium]|nr:hypothetical protein [Gammaproteobacteria bacterium]
MAKKSKTGKPGKKKATRDAKKTPAKRGAPKKPARPKKRPTVRKGKEVPLGYLHSAGGLLIPAKMSEEVTPVPPAKIRSGLTKARDEIKKLMEALSELTEGYTVSEIELAASFNADGKFLGIGVGGATTIRVRFRPEENGGSA